jgi:hypothetical protein
VTRLVQIDHPVKRRRVALVDGGRLQLLATHRSVYGFAMSALQTGLPLEKLIAEDVSPLTLSYDEIYSSAASGWRFLPSFDHPDEPARCLISGTGLTHLSSGTARGAVTSGAQEDAKITDGMRLYQAGVENGRPAAGSVGAVPEWFYKGAGAVLRGHRDPLIIPNYAQGGGEEAEIAAVYLIDSEGVPRRLGFTPGNEFSDHRTRKLNVLYHSAAKHRSCSIGPELIIGAEFSNIRGAVSIHRAGSPVWSREILTGEDQMVHSLANLEHHHFKYDDHRRPGDAHVHFLGATAFSFAAGFAIEDGDEVSIEFEGFGRALRNPVSFDRREQRPIAVASI